MLTLQAKQILTLKTKTKQILTEQMLTKIDAKFVERETQVNCLSVPSQCTSFHQSNFLILNMLDLKGNQVSIFPVSQAESFLSDR